MYDTILVEIKIENLLNVLMHKVILVKYIH